MSDNVLKLIPSSHNYVPSKEAIDKALSIINGSPSLADDVKFEVNESPRFIDQGSNWEKVNCPNCNAIIDTTWWQQAIDQAYENGFKNLAVKVPCCDTETYLNKLKYEWPAGFARFSIEILNPVMDISETKLKELEIALGCSLIKIWAHY